LRSICCGSAPFVSNTWSQRAQPFSAACDPRGLVRHTGSADASATSTCVSAQPPAGPLQDEAAGTDELENGRATRLREVQELQQPRHRVLRHVLLLRDPGPRLQDRWLLSLLGRRGRLSCSPCSSCGQRDLAGSRTLQQRPELLELVNNSNDARFALQRLLLQQQQRESRDWVWSKAAPRMEGSATIS
jgi:hypothetical protein